MSDNETIADIATELRQDYKGRPPINRAETTWCRRLIADRIDAAHKREVEKLNSVIQATVSRSDAEIDRLRREVVEASSRAATSAVNLTNEKWRREHGNAAKLRTGMECIRNAATCGGSDFGNPAIRGLLDQMEKICAIANAALAAPPRNCDMLCAATVEENIDAALKRADKDSMIDYDDEPRFARWFVSTPEEVAAFRAEEKRQRQERRRREKEEEREQPPPCGNSHWPQNVKG